MKQIASASLAVFIFLCMLVATERQAWGYVDPGSGLLALQSFASVAAACGYFMRRRIRSLFSRSGDEGKEAMPVDPEKGNSANAA